MRKRKYYLRGKKHKKNTDTQKKKERNVIRQLNKVDLLPFFNRGWVVAFPSSSSSGKCERKRRENNHNWGEMLVLCAINLQPRFVGQKSRWSTTENVQLQKISEVPKAQTQTQYSMVLRKIVSCKQTPLQIRRFSEAFPLAGISFLGISQV